MTKMRGGSILAMLVLMDCLPLAVRADVSAVWSQNADGNWSSGSNWSGGNSATGTTGVATFSNAITANRTVTVDASPWAINGLAFTNTGSYGWTLAGGTLVLSGTAPSVSVGAGSSAKISAVLAGNTGLTKMGTGTLILSGANTYSGGTQVSGSGTLQIGDGTGASATAGTGMLTLGAGATLLFNANAAVTLGNTSVTSASAVIQNNGSGKVTFTNGTVLGTVNGGSAGIVLANPITADFSPRGDVTLTSTSSGRTIISGAPGTVMHIVGNGVFWWIGSNQSANAPTLDIAAGVTASLNGGQVAGAIYYSNLTGAGNFTFDGGDANQIGYLLGTNTLTGTLTAKRPFSFGNGGTGGLAGSGAIAATSTGAVLFNSTVDNTYYGTVSGAGSLIKNNANALTLTGVSTYSGATAINGGTLIVANAGQLGGGTYLGAIANSGTFVYGSSAAQTFAGVLSGTGRVVKTGSGTLTLTGYNSYSGTTSVSAGELVGGTGGASYNSAVIVGDGATNGVKVVSYGDAWTCGSLSYTGGVAGLDFDFAAYPVSAATAPLKIAGDLCVTGTVNITVRNGVWPAPGTYPLASYTGNLIGTGNFALTQLPSGVSATLVNNTDAKRLDLSVTAVPAASAASVWTRLTGGNASGLWGASENWSAGVPNAADAIADFGTLDLTANAYVTNETPRTVGGFRFADTTASHDWTVTNAALTLATTQGVPTLTVSNRTATFFSGLTGNQGFFKDGVGMLSLAGGTSDTFGGQVTVAAGTLFINNGATLKNTTSPFWVVSGGSLSVYANWDGNTVTNAMTLNGRGIGTWGALHAGQNVTLTGPITLASDCRITYRDNCNINGPITATGAGKNLELHLSEYMYANVFNGKINLGTGTLTLNSIAAGRIPQGFTAQLNAANTYSGGTVLTNYTILKLGNSAALGSGGLTLYPNTGLDLNTCNLSLPALSAPAGGAGITDSGASTGTTVLALNQAVDTGFSGTISNGASRTISLIKTGTGAFTLVGTNTYSGATLVSNGTFGVSGALGTGAVTVCTGSVFGAGPTGAVARATLAGTLTFQNNSRLWVDVQGAAADTLVVSNSIAIGSGVELRVSGDQTRGGNWKVLESVTGTVSGTVTLVGGLHGASVSYTANAVWLNIPLRGTEVLLR